VGFIESIIAQGFLRCLRFALLGFRSRLGYVISIARVTYRLPLRLILAYKLKTPFGPLPSEFESIGSSRASTSHRPCPAIPSESLNTPAAALIDR
jgi:hypothetical protein